MIRAITIWFAAFFCFSAFADDASHRLDALFKQLSQASNIETSDKIILHIYQLWASDSDNGANLQLMRRGIAFMESGNLANAEAVFTTIIQREPDFTEAWNKRATVRYLLGNFADSERDIAQTLQREERHFGALVGLAVIKKQQGDAAAALQIFEHVLEIHPFNRDAKRHIPALRQIVKGQPI